MSDQPRALRLRANGPIVLGRSTSPQADSYRRSEGKLEGICLRIREILDGLSEHLLRAYYELGKEVLKTTDLPQMSTYRGRLVEVIAEELEVNPRTLYDCARLVETVPEETFLRVAKPPLCWTHIRILMAQRQLGRLEHWAEQIEKEELTTTELEDELRDGAPPKREGGGRRPSPPKSLRAGLNQWKRLSSTFLNKVDVLFGDEFDIASDIKNTPPDEFTDDFCTNFADATAQLERIAKETRGDAQRMRKALHWMEHMVESQKELAEAERQRESADRVSASPSRVGPHPRPTILIPQPDSGQGLVSENKVE